MERQGPLPRSLVFISTQETDTGSSLREALLEEGFDVTWFPQSELFDATLQEATPDLAILDLSPNFCGSLESLRKLRELSSCPLLALSPNGGDAEIIAALEWADDYVLKPFSTRELLARVRALLRRLERQGAGSEIPRTKGLRHKGLFLDLGTKTVHVGARTAALTTAEFFIIHLMMREPYRCFTRAELGELPLRRPPVGSRTIDVHIGNLRKKIVPLGLEFTPFVAIRGGGYRFDNSFELQDEPNKLKGKKTGLAPGDEVEAGAVLGLSFSRWRWKCSS